VRLDPGLLLILLLLLAGVVVALAVLATRSRSRVEELERARATEVAAAVDAELARRAHESDERADAVRRDVQAEAERTRALAEQALAAAEQARAEAADDVRRAEERRAQVEADVAAARTELARLREEAERREERLAERESRLDAELAALAERRTQAETLAADAAARAAEADTLRAGVEAERSAALERVAGLTADDAKAELVAGIEQQAKREAALTVRDIERAAKDEGEERARRIVTLAAQRVASAQTAESSVSVLHLPDDSMKGRIIGREGRNIRTFEAVTGVNLLIDDTPEAVLLSSFDPVRREIARVTLEALVADGRIQPSRIEEEYERSRLEVDARCIRAAEDALVDVGIGDMHPDLIALLGRLRYRTSYGQNVLGHLVECAHLAGIMAAELRLPVEHAKRCALLHDIGKALTHEVEGSHALIGAEVARRYGEHEDVVHAIEAHHNEVEVRTLEAVLTQTADSMSGGRPGARRESLEHYVERLERLEAIASSYAGVEKVFAMQAGREVRVVVLPDAVDDIGMQVLARDIAAEIEHELTYPGQIRVTVVRESRATGLAR
jgi:ribonuclease Y